MIAKICDACKKILKEKEIRKAYSWDRYYELCEECKIKFDKIHKQYTKDREALINKVNALEDDYMDKLKGMGIDNE